MTDQHNHVLALPVATVAQSTAITPREGMDLPRLITDAGARATLRFINFFTAQIEIDNARQAYYRAVRQFDAWCARRGVGIRELQPIMLAA